MSEHSPTRPGQTVPIPSQPSRPVRRAVPYRSSPVNDSLHAHAQVKTTPDQTSQRDDPLPKSILSKRRSDSTCNMVMSRNRSKSLPLTTSTNSTTTLARRSCTIPTCRNTTVISVVFINRPSLVLPSYQIGSTMIRLSAVGVKNLPSFHSNTALPPTTGKRDTFTGSPMENQLGQCTLTPLGPTQGPRSVVVLFLRNPCTW